MASNRPDNGGYDPSGEPRPDRFTGRAKVGPPASGHEPYGQPEPQPPAHPPPYRPQPYQSSAYRGMPYQRPVTGPAPKRVRPSWGRIVFVTIMVLGLLVSCGGLVGWLWVRGVDQDMKREDAFSALADRPPKLVDGALNILLLGTDSRDPAGSSEPSGVWRTDTLVLVHIPASHDRAYLVSIPRDLWVYIPTSSDGQNGGTMAKINAAYAWGGMPLAVQTVEQYTGVHVDHVALIDFAGFVAVTDAVGGVDMTVDETFASLTPPFRTYEAGPRHFTGEEALDFVRQRYQFPDGDFARMRHQQMFLKALLEKSVSLGTLTNLGSLRAFVTSVADTLTVDQDFSLVDLAWQFRGLRGDDLVFLISPNLGTDMIGDESVIVSDRETALAFYDAMAHDTMDDWVSVHGTGW